MSQWHFFKRPQELTDAAVELILKCARRAVSRRGEFKMVLAGGTTPLECYRRLAAGDADLGQWQLYYGDERCLPESHGARNSVLVGNTGLSAKVGGEYVIPAELGPEKAAELYQETISSVRPFDLVLLGVGEDGHTASLFPYDLENWSSTSQPVISVYESPKPPKERVSLNLSALQHCHDMLVLVTGDSKRDAVCAWRNGKILPISMVAGVNQARVYCEQRLLC